MHGTGRLFAGCLLLAASGMFVSPSSSPTPADSVEGATAVRRGCICLPLAQHPPIADPACQGVAGCSDGPIKSYLPRRDATSDWARAHEHVLRRRHVLRDGCPTLET